MGLAMTLRDNLMDQEYFDKWLAFKGERIRAMTEKSRKPGVNARYDAQYVFSIFINHYELMIQRYSRGDPLGELKAYLPEVVAAWEWAYQEEIKVFTDEEMADRKQFRRNRDFYVICLWLISIAICLEVDDTLLARMVKLIGNEGEDRLYELLLATRVPGRKSAPALLYPKPYEPLYYCMVTPERAGEWMKQFLKQWYPAMKGAYWHDCHKGPEGGGYFGYWCFEAAGVVKAFRLDDSAFRDMAYYPKDLAAYRA